MFPFRRRKSCVKVGGFNLPGSQLLYEIEQQPE